MPMMRTEDGTLPPEATHPVLDSAVGPSIPPESNADHEPNPSFFFWTANGHTDDARVSAAAPADRSQTVLTGKLKCCGPRR